MKNYLDWDTYYALYLRYSFVAALIITNLFFLALPREFLSGGVYKLRKESATIAEELPPELEQLAQPPQLARPQLPVATENPEEVEAATIEKTNITEITKRPEETDIPIVPYWVVEVKPEPVDIPKPSYPELCRQAGIEGQTVIKALVSIDGSIEDAAILKSSGNTSLDQAALAAARNAKFRPAKQRDQLVRVWVSIPFKFSLTGGK